MTKWIDYIESQNPDLIWRKRVNNNFGDWLQIGANTPPDVLSTAYFAYDSLLLSKMATAINRTADAQKYLALHSKISDSFMKAFVNSTDAKIQGDTQTVYLLALAFELLPKQLRKLAANHLVENIKAHDWHLTTGFVGMP
jgi:alpha-L-rhamnosidase